MPSWIRASAAKLRGTDPWVAGAAALLILYALAALLAPWLAPEPPQIQHLAEGLAIPSWSHPLGQDKLGRDVLARLLWGARVALGVGFVCVVISLIIGVTLGLVSGYAGGWIDFTIMRVVDVFLAFPGILLAIALAAVLGPRLVNVIVALAAFGWVPFARLARAQTLSLRGQEFVLAARSVGASPARILFRHLLPAIAAPLAVQASFSLAGAVLAEASLSFLGLGPQDLPSWGAMLTEGAEFLGEAPHLSWAPGLALALLVLSFNVLGDRLRDSLGR